MKKVLVDLLFYTGTRGGMESYVREVYSRVTETSPDFTFVGLASAELSRLGAPWFPGQLIDSGISSQSAARWAIGELTVTSRVAKRIHADLIHSPANIGPIFSRVPVVLTIQDVLSFRHPEFVPAFSGRILRWLIRAAARNARRIITISSGSAADINTFLGIPRDDLTVIALAGSELVSAGIENNKARSAQPMLLSGGNRLPHKNFANLIRALALIPQETRPRLVLTGGSSPDPLQSLVDELAVNEWVDLRGWVTTSELARLYSEATVYVFPTRFEGFGLPVLEAMARGCPVICSDIPVLRDVGGDAATYVDTRDPHVLARALESLLADPAKRDQARRRGFDQAKKFSWENTAAATVAVFRTV